MQAEKDTVVILRDLQSAFPFATTPVHSEVQVPACLYDVLSAAPLPLAASSYP